MSADLGAENSSSAGAYKRIVNAISHVHDLSNVNAQGEESFGGSGAYNLEFLAVDSPFIVSKLYSWGGSISAIEVDGVSILSKTLAAKTSGTSGTILAYKDLSFPFHRIFDKLVVTQSLKMTIHYKAFVLAFTDVEV